MQMLQIFLSIVPFFAIILCGYGAARSGLFNTVATDCITKFVFFFALPAMLFSFASTVSISKLIQFEIIAAYSLATVSVYMLVKIVALARKVDWAQSAVEAQCAAIGNVGFLGLPMLVVLMGQAAAGPVILILALDLIVFGSLIVVFITASREGWTSSRSIARVCLGVVKNPMILAMVLGLIWPSLGIPEIQPFLEFVDLLAGAATPSALFAIGMSLATKSAERYEVALWLSVSKLVLHPIAMAFFTLFVFDVTLPVAGIMIAAAAMPTAGNIYIIANHYKVAPMRVSSTILISTTISVLTLTLVISWVFRLSG